MFTALTTSSPLPFYGHASSSRRLADYEPLAKICSSFMFDLFTPTPSLDCAGNSYDPLPYFIAVAFSQSQLPEANALAALTLLQRLKSHHPTRTFSSPPKRKEPERLFLASYIAATKVLSDERYHLNFWAKVGQNKFSVEELTTMEKEFFEDLEWDVQIDDATLAIYQLLVERRRQVEEAKDMNRWKSRSDSLESHSSSNSSESTDSSGWGPSDTSGSPVPSIPSTPSDSLVSDPVIAIQRRLKESKQNLTDVGKCIEDLEQKLTSLISESSPRSRASATKPCHGTRHLLKEKFLHVFH